jgi:hypothetical protein
MSIPELARLARRHWIAMLVVLLITGGTAYHFRHTAPLYQDSASVLISPTPSLQGDNGVLPGTLDTLIITAGVMVDWLNSPQGSQQVLQDGGTGSYQFGLVNFYDQEYPQYLQPVATLNTTSYSPAVAERTFTAALSALQQELQARQAAFRVPHNQRILAYVVGGPSGPVELSGYPKRTYGGLALLALIAAYFVARLLDRHPGWGMALRAYLQIPARLPRSGTGQHPSPARASSSAGHQTR